MMHVDGLYKEVSFRFHHIKNILEIFAPQSCVPGPTQGDKAAVRHEKDQ